MFAQSITLSLLLSLSAAPALAGVEDCPTRSNNTFNKLLECVTLGGVRQHQAALQAIADANGGYRLSGTSGYDASVDYVSDELVEAGYAVTVQPFQLQTFIQLSPALLEQVAPAPAGPIDNSIMTYSGSGDVTAAVSTVNDMRGCNATDFAGFPAGNIALIIRGTCTFATKATNAFNAGASGVIIYNNVPGPFSGTLGTAFTLDIGVTSVALDVGQQLAATPGLVMRLKTDTFRGIATTYNVLAETLAGDPNNVVIVGAHLDSVNAGPGINDNGSGVAAVLEIARQMALVDTRNKVRFAFWGATESGFVGSTYYVNSLPPTEFGKIALYLDAHMLGSPNAVLFVLDGDNSDGVGAGAGPAGSAEIERTFATFFDLNGIPSKGTDLSGRSDYRPFALNNVPVGGVFAGAEGIKTVEEAAVWGGAAGIAYDPCYQQACDTFANNNDRALDINADATAYATLKYAMDTSDVNDVRGKGNFKKKKVAPVPPAGLATR